MGRALQRAWLRRGALAWALRPASLLFGALAALRRGLFGVGLLPRRTMPVPVIVVGNVITGGSGKTPVVMAVVDHLLARGLKVGVVSRGYGRRSKDCLEARPGALAAEVGDEPLLIANSCRVPVFVAARRADAARALLAAYPATQVIVADDGLQHLALARDIEVCVFDERGLGNGWLLPAGPLREPWPRRADLVLHMGSDPRIQGFTLRRALADQAMRGDGTRTPLGSLRGQPLKAVAGIAKPEAFFAMLRERGLTLARSIALPDHYDFSRSSSLAAEGLALICTEKDAVKLWRSRPQAWAVPLVLQIEPAFWQRLDTLLDARLSSPHGSQTA